MLSATAQREDRCLIRPAALQKLLEEIRARRIDVVVVYKIDRLTRSLSDFAKLVELFDAHEVSIISVTQAFNTTTSMGRLTLNMLLSFAQFEREITGERIRDKVAASKKKGIWMGGAVPLGYRVENRALHIVEAEADVVRMLFQRYLELGSVVRLKAALVAEAILSPIRVSQSGKVTGGRPMSRGCLYGILSNPIYLGRLRHKELIHEGLHSAIIDLGIWEAAQERLCAQTITRRDPEPDLHSFLVGKLYDDKGSWMAASFACKGAKRYRYYISRPTLIGEAQGSGSIARVAAAEVEREVTRAVERHLAAQLSKAEVQNAIERVTIGAIGIETLLTEASVAEGEKSNPDFALGSNSLSTPARDHSSRGYTTVGTVASQASQGAFLFHRGDARCPTVA
jgi:site-specific DNA recombinase